MTTDEYLRTCSNIPQLPAKWRWLVTDSEHESRSGNTYLRVTVSIIDEAGNIIGRAAHPVSKKYLPRLIESGGADQILPDIFRSAYNSLYTDRRISFCEVLGIDPTL